MYIASNYTYFISQDVDSERMPMCYIYNYIKSIYIWIQHRADPYWIIMWLIMFQKLNASLIFTWFLSKPFWKQFPQIFFIILRLHIIIIFVSIYIYIYIYIYRHGILFKLICKMIAYFKSKLKISVGIDCPRYHKYKSEHGGHSLE